MGTAGEKLKTCCSHAPCEFEHVTDKVHIAPISTQEQAAQSTLQDSTEKNKQIIASHMKAQSKTHIESVSPPHPKFVEENIAGAPKLKIKVRES